MEQDKPLPHEHIAPSGEQPHGEGPPARDTVSDAEFPAAVYASVVLAFTWVLIASWLMFGGTTDMELDLGIAAVIFLMMLGLPIVLGKMAATRNRLPREELDHFLTSDVEIATGRLSGSQAWIQILLIPGALAFAATMIGAVKVIFG